MNILYLKYSPTEKSSNEIYIQLTKVKLKVDLIKKYRVSDMEFHLLSLCSAVTSENEVKEKENKSFYLNDMNSKIQNEH